MKFITNLAFASFIIALSFTISFGQNNEAENYCANLSEIKSLPQRDGTIDDKAYKDILSKGDKAIPCLIERIIDTTKMEDPRCPKFTDQFMVGDMAYFILQRLGKFGFTEMFPLAVQEDFKTNGVYAYHDFIDQKGNRKLLQNRLREWYSQREIRTLN